MKVQLKKEMVMHTRGGYSINFAAKESVTLHKTPSKDLLIEDSNHNKILVTDSDILQAVMENSTYGKRVNGTANLKISRICEEVDPELVADFIAATDQIPNESAEKGAEDKLTDEEGGLDDISIEVPVTRVEDEPVEKKIEVLTEEEDEAVVPEDIADFEAQSVELVDDSPAFVKDQSDDEESPIAEVDNDPEVDAPSETPKGEDEEFYDVDIDIEKMKESVETIISPDGSISMTTSDEEPEAELYSGDNNEEDFVEESDESIEDEEGTDEENFDVDLDEFNLEESAAEDEESEEETVAGIIEPASSEDDKVEPVLPEEPIINPDEKKEARRARIAKARKEARLRKIHEAKFRRAHKESVIPAVRMSAEEVHDKYDLDYSSDPLIARTNYYILSSVGDDEMNPNSTSVTCTQEGKYFFAALNDKEEYTADQLNALANEIDDKSNSEVKSLLQSKGFEIFTAY